MKNIIIIILCFLFIKADAQSIEQKKDTIIGNPEFALHSSDAIGNRSVIRYDKLTDTISGNNLTYNLAGLTSLRVMLAKVKYSTNYQGNIIIIGDSETESPTIFVDYFKDKFDIDFGEAYAGYGSVNGGLEGFTPFNSTGTFNNLDFNSISGRSIDLVNVGDSCNIFFNYAYKQSRPDALKVLYKTCSTCGTFDYKVWRDNTATISHSGSVNTNGALGVGELLLTGLDTTGGFGHQHLVITANTANETIYGYQAITTVKNSIQINKIGRGGWSAENYWEEVINNDIAFAQLDSLNPNLICIMLGSNDTNFDDTVHFNRMSSIINKIHTKLPNVSILLITPSDVVPASELVSTIEELEKVQKKLCDKYRDFVGQISIRRILGTIDNNYYNGTTSDGVHDSVLGGKINADFIYNAIK